MVFPFITKVLVGVKVRTHLSQLPSHQTWEKLFYQTLLCALRDCSPKKLSFKVKSKLLHEISCYIIKISQPWTHALTVDIFIHRLKCMDTNCWTKFCPLPVLDWKFLLPSEPCSPELNQLLLSAVVEIVLIIIHKPVVSGKPSSTSWLS